ncbi:guanylate kinase [Buchnera aphidicola (Neophyllaphis varicolor)]|uniref:guanylate kinase n=1 Tax=Buchnera aphidicola TaxID=9 RepID=UPI0031B82410
MSIGKIFIISAPSGAGKSSLINALLKTKLIYDTKVSISHTTRTIRPGENNGQHYYFISKEEFFYMIKKKQFLEYAKVFNNYYGTSKLNVYKVLSEGMDIFLDIDWQGAKQIKDKIPDSKSIFLLPPSKRELYNRLLFRSQDSNNIIKKRMSKSVLEMNHYVEYDYLIINDNFNSSIINLRNIICAERLSTNRQKIKYKLLINELLNN